MNWHDFTDNFNRKIYFYFVFKYFIIHFATASYFGTDVHSAHIKKSDLINL